MVPWSYTSMFRRVEEDDSLIAKLILHQFLIIIMFLLWLQYQTLIKNLIGIVITACCKTVHLYIYLFSSGELGERERPSLNP